MLIVDDRPLELLFVVFVVFSVCDYLRAAAIFAPLFSGAEKYRRVLSGKKTPIYFIFKLLLQLRFSKPPTFVCLLMGSSNHSFSLNVVWSLMLMICNAT